MMGGTFCRKQSLLAEVEELSAEGEHTHIPRIFSLSSCVEQNRWIHQPKTHLGAQNPSVKVNNMWISYPSFPHISKDYGWLFSPIFSPSHTRVCVCANTYK